MLQYQYMLPIEMRFKISTTNYTLTIMSSICGRSTVRSNFNLQRSAVMITRIDHFYRTQRLVRVYPRVGLSASWLRRRVSALT